tara:strand:+ start:82386 stop:82523 length:138 start_codon:yes stop_codon:yes gene_type:complete
MSKKKPQIQGIRGFTSDLNLQIRGASQAWLSHTQLTLNSIKRKAF